MNGKIIKIKQTKLSSRCEICHQADCFDPKTEECSRCAKLNLKPVNIDYAIRQYIFNKVFIFMAFMCISCLLFTVYVAYSLKMLFDTLGVMSIIFAFIGLSFFSYYQYRCRRMIWLVKNVQPINVEFVLSKVPELFGSNRYYIQLKLNKRLPVKLPVYPPPWNINSIIDKPYPALAYFDKKGGLILRLDRGFLMSLSNVDFSPFLNNSEKA